MSLHTLLYRRGATYYFRQRVPLDLVPCIGKSEIRYSLGTADSKEALKHHKVLAAKVSEHFEAIRLGNHSELCFDLGAKRRTFGSMTNSQIAKVFSNKSPTLWDLYNTWLEEKKGNHNISTADEWERAVRRFTEFAGNLPIANIHKKQHARPFKSALAEFPAHMSNKHNKLPFLEIIQLAKEGSIKSKPLSAGTIDKYLTALTTLARIAIEDGDIHTNPFVGLKSKDAKNIEPERERIYTTAELRLLFNSPIYTGCHHYQRVKKGDNIIRDARFWIPLLGLFTGSRSEQLCQLYVSDIRFSEEYSIWYIDFNNDDDKTAKTAASIRQLPIHNELIKCGFLDYVNKQKEAGHKQLFPELNKDKRKKRYTPLYSKQYNRYLDAIGIDQLGKNYHSFRHNVETALAMLEINQTFIDAIVGHANKTSQRTYLSGRPEVINPQLQKLKYDIDLSHLYNDTKFPLNPEAKAQESTATSRQSKHQPKEVSIKEAMRAVSLAEAYQRIGKAHYGDEWVDYEFNIRNRKHNLKTLRHKGHNKKLILPPLNHEQFSKLTQRHDEAERIGADKETHRLINRYLTKGIFSKDGITCYYKETDKPSRYVLDEPMRAKLHEHGEGFLLSRIRVKDGKSDEHKNG